MNDNYKWNVLDFSEIFGSTELNADPIADAVLKISHDMNVILGDMSITDLRIKYAQEKAEKNRHRCSHRRQRREKSAYCG